jgi:hypothetical protein
MIKRLRTDDAARLMPDGLVCADAEVAELEAKNKALVMALGMATSERNLREQKIDQILQTNYYIPRTVDEYFYRARRHIEATERAVGYVLADAQEAAGE